MNDRPLSAHALDMLRLIDRNPVPRQEVNSGVARALENRGLVEVIDGPSPYKTRKGTVQYLRVTEAGRTRARE